jgi:hypothetical protein
VCDRRTLSPEASDLLGAMLTDLGEALVVSPADVRRDLYDDDSGQPGCGRAPSILGDGPGGSDVSALAPGEAAFEVRIEQLEAMLRRARGRETLAVAASRFWRRRFELASNPRGQVARTDAAAGELKLARVAGGAEQLLRAATRLLRHAMQDPAAVSSTAWADEAREVLRAEER